MACATEYSEGVFGFDGLRGGITEHRHHVQEVFECAIAIVAGTEHLAYPIAEGVHAQLGVAEDFRHG